MVDPMMNRRTRASGVVAQRVWASGMLLVLATASVAGGCKWTEFDDLEKETWVSSTGTPNSDSSDYGIAIQRGSLSSASGGKLVVIGTGQAQYTELLYSPNGEADLAPTAIKLSQQFGVANLDPQPILIADPSGNEVSLVANSGGQSISVLTGTSGLVPHVLSGPAQPDAANYVQPPLRNDPGHVGEAQPMQPIVASGDTVYGTYFANPPTPQPKCQILDDAGMPVVIRGIAGARITSTMFDDLVIWTSTGKLLLNGGQAGWDPGIASGGLISQVVTDTGFQPGRGSQLISIDGKYVLLVGHKDAGDSASFLALYDVTTMDTAVPTKRAPTRIGNPITIPDLRTAAILDLGASGRFVVAGYPTATFDGVKAGRVLAFPLSTTTGLGDTPAMTLHDAQPGNDQIFGRAVAVTQFNGRQVIAVAANNEIFLYYRTTLYDETRQGQ